MIRRRWLFSGRVQGVGFRITTARVAMDRPVNGYVRNLPDGTVEAVAEGAEADLDGFQAAIASEMSANIRDVACQQSPATGEFTAFDVRF